MLDAFFLIDRITLQLSLRAGDEAHQARRCAGPDNLCLLKTCQVVQVLHCRGQPRDATRRTDTRADKQMNDFICRNDHVQLLVLQLRERRIAWVLLEKRVAPCAAKLITLDTHPPDVLTVCF